MLHNNLIRGYRIDFRLFDGEGGSGGNGNAGGLGAEASAFLDSITPPGEKKQTKNASEEKPDVRSMQYGKTKGDDQRTSQSGTDASGGEDLAAEFAELIGKDGRYHDIYGQKVAETVQARFKNQKDMTDTVKAYDDMLSPLYLNYGLKLGDQEGLKAALARDDTLFKAGAEREGLDLNQYKEKLKLAEQAERGRQITEAYEAQQRQSEMYAQWEADAVTLQQSFPRFDLLSEIQSNQQFADLLDNGVDVQTAFVSTHLAEIMSGSHAESYASGAQDVVNNIQARASRPVEAGLRHSPAIQRKSDPSQLTGEDVDEIMRRVQNGDEQFSF